MFFLFFFPSPFDRAAPELAYLLIACWETDRAMIRVIMKSDNRPLSVQTYHLGNYPRTVVWFQTPSRIRSRLLWVIIYCFFSSFCCGHEAMKSYITDNKKPINVSFVNFFFLHKAKKKSSFLQSKSFANLYMLCSITNAVGDLQNLWDIAHMDQNITIQHTICL